RVGSLAANLVVDYSVSGTAVMGDDYAALPGSITIPAGRTSALITVTPVDDALVEGDETITISLTSSPAYNVSDPATATVTLIDSEIPTVTLAASDAVAAEPGSDTGAFTFTRTGSTAAPLTVHFHVNGTALSGVDFVALGSSIEIAAGASTAVLAVTPLDDTIREVDERVVLTLAADPAYVLGTTAPTTVTIRDNDGGNLPGVGFTFASSSGPESKTPARL